MRRRRSTKSPNLGNKFRGEKNGASFGGKWDRRARESSPDGGYPITRRGNGGLTLIVSGRLEEEAKRSEDGFLSAFVKAPVNL